MAPLYSIDDIPVHSTVQLTDRAEALGFPTGHLTLSYCRRCAFLANTRYDALLTDYSAHCEESQHASPTFTQFATNLAQRWIDRYSIRNKTILEVGCGKGEFLALMCELGDNRGVGIDPGYRPGRSSASAARRLEFINERYSEKHAAIEADVILCRHTLEHIGQVGEFVRMLRRAVGNRKETLVLFELPDVTRVLRETAFWDVYYEHCSYFSPGSLARLFRASNFALLELTREYGDQYLVIAAKPTEAPTGPALIMENDMDGMHALATRFADRVNGSIQSWANLIRSARAKGEKIVIWSALSKAVAFLTTAKVGAAIEFATDINPARHGKFLPVTGQEIRPPGFLAQYQPDWVILMNPIYAAEVQRVLDEMKVKAKILALGPAVGPKGWQQ